MDRKQASSGGGFFTRWFGGSGSNTSQQNLSEDVIDARSERKTAKQREQELLQRSERRSGVCYFMGFFFANCLDAVRLRVPER